MMRTLFSQSERFFIRKNKRLALQKREAKFKATSSEDEDFIPVKRSALNNKREQKLLEGAFRDKIDSNQSRLKIGSTTAENHRATSNR